MGSSSETLFHFTTSVEQLVAILKKGIAPSYCRERLPYASSTFDLFVPMASFSNIKLSDVKNQIESYGSYGVGVTLDWARSHELNPVHYVHGYSKVFRSAFDLFLEIHDRWNALSNSPEKEAAEKQMVMLMNSIGNCKPFEGPLERKGEVVHQRYRFYDEREWRFLPFERLMTDDHPVWMTKAQRPDYEEKYASKPHLPSYALKLTSIDIKYLIIESDKDIGPLISALKGMSGFTANEVESLIPRLLTMQQIKEDF